MSTTSNGGASTRSKRRAAKDASSPSVDQRTVALSQIHVEEGFNPRQHFDEAALEQLAASIRLRGLLQPLVVTTNGDDGFRLVAGERRYRAAVLADVAEVPVIVRPVDEQTRGLDDALIENLSRRDLDPVEEARAFQRLLDTGLTRKGIVEALPGVSQRLVTERLQILSLPEELHAQIADGAIPPSAVKPLAELAKAHAGLPAVAVGCVLDPPVEHYYEPPTWADLVEDPVVVLLDCASADQLPPDVYESGAIYPLSRFTLSEKAAADLEKLVKLLDSEPEAIEIRFGRESLEQALALKAALMSQNGHVHGAFILGQDVADQLASDQVSARLKTARSDQRRRREHERNRAALAADSGPAPGTGDSSEAVEDPAEKRQRENAERAERRREAIAYNAELGAAVFGKLSRIKVDEHVLKVLSAVGFHADLGQLAARGARYGFPGWVTETTTKTGKPKLEYLSNGEAEEKARDYLAGAKTAGDIAGRLFALVVMAVYAKQDAVAQSSQVGYEVSFYSPRLPWSHDVVRLVEQIAEERLPEPLTEWRKAARKETERREREARKAERARVAAKDELLKQLPELSAEERDAALQQFTADHGAAFWSDEVREIRDAIAELNRAEETPPEAAADVADQPEPQPDVHDVDDSELDYSDGEASEEGAELVAG